MDKNDTWRVAVFSGEQRKLQFIKDGFKSRHEAGNWGSDTVAARAAVGEHVDYEVLKPVNEERPASR